MLNFFLLLLNLKLPKQKNNVVLFLGLLVFVFAGILIAQPAMARPELIVVHSVVGFNDTFPLGIGTGPDLYKTLESPETFRIIFSGRDLASFSNNNITTLATFSITKTLYGMPLESDVLSIIPNSIYYIGRDANGDDWISMAVVAIKDSGTENVLSGHFLHVGNANENHYDKAYIRLGVKDINDDQSVWWFIGRLIKLIGDLFKWLGGLLLDLVINVFPLSLLKFFIAIINEACYFVASASYKLFHFIISEFIKNTNNKYSITTGTMTTKEGATVAGLSLVFVAAWDIVKSYANMVIVVSLVAVAAMMIMRLWVDKAKQLLPQIIITALLVNFSIVFVGLIIDVANILIKEFVAGGDGMIRLLWHLNDGYNNLVSPLKDRAIDLPKTIQYFAMSSLFWAMYIFFAVTLFIFSYIVVKRYLALGILFILSPLAFAFRIFPHESVQKLWSDWWQNFLKYSFILIPVAFFLRLSVDILDSPALDFTATDSGNMARFFLGYALVAGILFAGMKMSVGMAGKFAKMTMGLGATALTGGLAAAGMGLKLGGKAMGGIGKIMGSTKWGGAVKDAIVSAKDNMKYRTTQMSERIGLVAQGSANKQRRDALGARMKPYESLAEAETDNNVVAERAMSSSSAAERAAYINVLHKRKKLNRIAPAQRQQAINDAMSHGIDVSKFADDEYSYAEFEDVNRTTIERIERTDPRAAAAGAAAGAHGTPAYIAAARNEARRIAVIQQLEENLPSMSSEQRRNIDAQHITHELTTSDSFTPKMARDFKTASRSRIQALKRTLPQIRDAIRNARTIIPGSVPPTPVNAREADRLQKIYDEIAAIRI